MSNNLEGRSCFDLYLFVLFLNHKSNTGVAQVYVLLNRSSKYLPKIEESIPPHSRKAKGNLRPWWSVSSSDLLKYVVIMHNEGEF